ncbi:TlpA disulfide reductase family protein [Corynebacterium sp. HMSC05E07]|uniref:TlpA disulfide reductase family protein n=1 Tax=Corynebacterium sp. HMSC05E07 TaxID=1581117 RepID=UPI0008A30AA6|nr:TlpA disulfide reductase family protein [Corynebacterium sp. HMSC05E07]OFT60160.1 effector protein [Corynebacterium sp. HMSC05E07]
MRGLKIGAAVVVAALALVGCSQSEDNSQNAVASGGTFQFISPGGQTTIRYDEADRKPLKDFSGEDLRDESTTIKLSDFKDQIVVLNSWGQWCAPCRSESDDLQAIHTELQKRDIGTVLGINVKDFNPDISRDFMADNGLEYPSIYDPPFKTAAALGGVPTSVVPTTIVLDKQHRPAAVFLTEITEKEVLEVVDELEKEQ